MLLCLVVSLVIKGIEWVVGGRLVSLFELFRGKGRKVVKRIITLHLLA